MKNNENDATPKMKTLSVSMNESLAKGYKENFKVITKGLSTEDGKTVYIPQEVAITDFFRFEGYSDPQDNSILYLIETNDGRKGMLIDSYGPETDTKITSFIHDVEDIHKKNQSWVWNSFL